MIQGGVRNLEVENFTFQPSGSMLFNDTLKVGGNASNIVIKNVIVEGAHQLGMRIGGCSGVLVDGGRVQGSAGNGFLISGTSAAPTSDIVFRAAQAIQCARDGFVVPSANNRVSNLTFDRTVATGNGAVGGDDGYDIQAAPAPTPTPLSAPVARFLDAEATGNGQNGFKVSMSAQLENVYAANNTNAGVAVGPPAGSAPSTVVGEVTVLTSTIRNTASPNPRIQAGGNDSRVLGFNLRIHNTIITGSNSIMWVYSKKYAGSANPPDGSGGEIRWTRDVVARADAGPRVRYFDRAGTPRDCSSDQTLGMCDAVGDCDYDFSVAVDEILIMTGIANGLQPLSACYQGDLNGDRTVTVDEIIAAVGAANDFDVHDRTQTSLPSFQGDGRHLTTSSAGSNWGLPPSSFAPLPVCRAGCCDADAHGRPEPGGGAYDIGAYEGTGAQAKVSACLNVAPGQCITCTAMATAEGPAAPLVTLAVDSVSTCAERVVEVPIAMYGGEAAVHGVQFDLLYDASSLSPADPLMACVPGESDYRGGAHTNLVHDGRLRVIVFDSGGTVLHDGTLVTCRFEIVGSAGEKSSLAIAKPIVAGRLGRVLESAATEGYVRIGGKCGE